MDTLELKRHLKESCQQHIDQRLLRIKKTILDIQESLTSETKSTAGDKHETGRAMLQLEREKAGAQLSEVEKLQAAVSKVDTSYNYNRVSLGSVVRCNNANYYICISAGAIICNSETFFAIAPSTPIGKLILGKSKNDVIHFKDKQIVIKEIL